MTDKWHERMLKQILRNQVRLAILAKAAAHQTTLGVGFHCDKVKEETESLIGPLDEASLRWDGSIR